MCGVRVRTTQTTPIAFPADAIAEGGTYELTVTGKQSGKKIVKEFQGVAKNASATTDNNGDVAVPTTDGEAIAQAEAQAAKQKEAATLAKTGVAIALIAILAAVCAAAGIKLRSNGIARHGDDNE